MSITQTAAAQHPWSRFTQSGQANLPYPLLNHLLKGLSLRLLASRLRFPNLARLLSPTIFCLNPWVKFIILKLLASRRTFKQSGQSPRSYPFSIKSFITMSYSEAPGLQVRTSQLSGKGPQIDNVLLKPFMKTFQFENPCLLSQFSQSRQYPEASHFLIQFFLKTTHFKSTGFQGQISRAGLVPPVATKVVESKPFLYKTFDTTKGLVLSIQLCSLLLTPNLTPTKSWKLL